MDSFEKFRLRPEIMRALKDMNFEKPTDIQREALPIVFQGEDVIGQAQTGTGKTAVFGIYLLESVNANVHEVQALVLAPTRELAMQITKEIKRIGKNTAVRALTVYGGQSINVQIDELRRGVQIVVGTPGRILDHLERGTLSLKNVKYVVVDEVDRMLDMGFIEDVENIIKHTRGDRQTLMFSATVPKEVVELSKKYQKYPQFISVSKDEVTIKHIRHCFVEVDYRDRYRALYAYLTHRKPYRAIIFCRTKLKVDSVADDLRKRGYRVGKLHGDLSQRMRDAMMAKFRSGEISILVATDLASRGIDLVEISDVINFNLPEEVDVYTHRVGRTGRMGRSGAAFSIVASDEMGLLGQIERGCGIQMEDAAPELSREHGHRSGHKRPGRA